MEDYFSSPQYKDLDFLKVDLDKLKVNYQYFRQLNSRKRIKVNSSAGYLGLSSISEESNEEHLIYKLEKKIESKLLVFKNKMSYKNFEKKKVEEEQDFLNILQ